MGRSDQSPPDWLDELPLDPGASVHAMGTRTLEPERWLQTLAGDDARRSEKQHILERHHDDVVGVLDGFTRPVQQAVEEIARRVGLDPVDRSLEDVSMATAEDLCVLSPVDARWVLVGGAVCFPSMWRLPDKLGLSIGRVHDPVPRYAEELEVRVDRFFDRMPLLRPVWRRNWFVHDVPDLFLPRPIHHDEPVEVPDGLWLRSERQSLVRLADDVIVFSIRTQQVPLRVVASRPDVALRMQAAVAAWPPDIVAYRGATGWRDEVAAWLGDTGARG